jgi:hypothetical protein
MTQKEADSLSRLALFLRTSELNEAWSWNLGKYSQLPSHFKLITHVK